MRHTIYDMASDPAAMPPKAVTRKLHRSGGSCVLTIPPMVMSQVGFAEGDEIAIHVDQKREQLVLTSGDTED